MGRSPQREVKSVSSWEKAARLKPGEKTKRNENTGRSEITELVAGPGREAKDTGETRRKLRRARAGHGKAAALRCSVPPRAGPASGGGGHPHPAEGRPPAGSSPLPSPGSRALQDLPSPARRAACPADGLATAARGTRWPTDSLLVSPPHPFPFPSSPWRPGSPPALLPAPHVPVGVDAAPHEPPLCRPDASHPSPPPPAAGKSPPAPSHRLLPRENLTTFFGSLEFPFCFRLLLIPPVPPPLGKQFLVSAGAGHPLPPAQIPPLPGKRFSFRDASCRSRPCPTLPPRLRGGSAVGLRGFPGSAGTPAGTGRHTAELGHGTAGGGRGRRRRPCRHPRGTGAGIRSARAGRHSRRPKTMSAGLDFPWAGSGHESGRAASAEKSPREPGGGDSASPAPAFRFASWRPSGFGSVTVGRGGGKGSCCFVGGVTATEARAAGPEPQRCWGNSFLELEHGPVLPETARTIEASLGRGRRQIFCGCGVHFTASGKGAARHALLLTVRGEGKRPNSGTPAAPSSRTSAELRCLGQRRGKSFEGALPIGHLETRGYPLHQPFFSHQGHAPSLTAGLLPRSRRLPQQRALEEAQLSREVPRLPGSGRQRGKTCAQPVPAVGSGLRPRARRRGAPRWLRRPAEQRDGNTELWKSGKGERLLPVSRHRGSRGRDLASAPAAAGRLLGRLGQSEGPQPPK